MAQEPPTINHFIGQHQVKKRFRVALEAAWNDGSRLPHMLMVGPAGCGKTVLAHIAAREMGVQLHERIGQNLVLPASLNGLLALANDKDIVFCDEIHEMGLLCQTLLYKAMEERKVFVDGPADTSFALPTSDFCLIAATTDEYALLPPLRDRFKLVLPFSYYDVESLGIITKQHAQMTGLAISTEVATEIAKRSRGTPRLAIRLLESCHRYARSKAEDQVMMQHFLETATLEGIDGLGLGPDEQRYLQLLADNQGQPVRLFSIEAAIGVHRRTIQSVIEPFLLRSGLIERCQNGRQITVSGLRHLGLIKEPQASVA
jgi:Holliday junction DNA helicase RuvB